MTADSERVQRGEISRVRMAAMIWRNMPQVVYERFFAAVLGSEEPDGEWTGESGRAGLRFRPKPKSKD